VGRALKEECIRGLAKKFDHFRFLSIMILFVRVLRKIEEKEPSVGTQSTWRIKEGTHSKSTCPVVI